MVHELALDTSSRSSSESNIVLSCTLIDNVISRMKCLIFALIKTFEFSLAVPKESVKQKIGIVQRPIIAGEEEKGVQLPLVLKVHVRA